MTGWVIATALAFFYFGYAVGHRFAHKQVAHECKALGGFYVDGEVFKCEVQS